MEKRICNDMHFSNEGSSNSIDGTWGDWTLQEGENDVFMINNRTGKKFAITMSCLLYTSPSPRDRG